MFSLPASHEKIKHVSANAALAARRARSRSRSRSRQRRGSARRGASRPRRRRRMKRRIPRAQPPNARARSRPGARARTCREKGTTRHKKKQRTTQQPSRPTPASRRAGEAGQRGGQGASETRNNMRALREQCRVESNGSTAMEKHAKQLKHNLRKGARGKGVGRVARRQHKFSCARLRQSAAAVAAPRGLTTLQFCLGLTFATGRGPRANNTTTGPRLRGARACAGRERSQARACGSEGAPPHLDGEGDANGASYLQNCLLCASSSFGLRPARKERSTSDLIGRTPSLARLCARTHARSRVKTLTIKER